MENKRPLEAPPHKLQIVDENGIPTPAFQKWMNELYVRVGGKLAPSNLQLERLKGYTVATLPAGTVGDMVYCTDLLTPTFFAVAVGGGAIVGPVFYDGTIWKSI